MLVCDKCLKNNGQGLPNQVIKYVFQLRAWSKEDDLNKRTFELCDSCKKRLAVVLNDTMNRFLSEPEKGT